MRAPLATPSPFQAIPSLLALNTKMNQAGLTKALFISSPPMALLGHNKLNFLHPTDLLGIISAPPSLSSAIHSSSVHQAMTSLKSSDPSMIKAPSTSSNALAPLGHNTPSSPISLALPPISSAPLSYSPATPLSAPLTLMTPPPPTKAPSSPKILTSPLTPPLSPSEHPQP